MPPVVIILASALAALLLWAVAAWAESAWLSGAELPAGSDDRRVVTIAPPPFPYQAAVIDDIFAEEVQPDRAREARERAGRGN
jgi:hypothetical protein